MSPGDIPGSSSYSVVAPFAADIDTSRTGSVKYTQFTTSDSSQMSRVSSFIRSETDNSFYGTRMMVAEWRGVPKYLGSIVSCTMCLHVCLFANGPLGMYDCASSSTQHMYLVIHVPLLVLLQVMLCVHVHTHILVHLISLMDYILH